MDKYLLADEIRTYLKSQGADIIGFADLRSLPADVRSDFPYGITIAVALDPEIIRKIINGPDLEYLLEYRRANELLGLLAEKAASFLEEQGYRANWFSATNTDIDWDTLSTKLPHKTVATRAGLGWIGKCALLIMAEYGSAVRITSVLTNAELPAGTPKDTSDCGDCHTCVDICPGNAVTGLQWEAGMSRDQLYDPFKCREVAQRLQREREGITDNICGMCIAACPWTQKYLDKSAR
ncbi:MAG: epoxyqueuosine reductase [Dehalococcoidales bacterium]|nr:MAG: epoxyqueuosine reductase [Dehalococcoidales bacterium]